MVEIVAEAQKESEILRGEGEAAAQRHLRRAFQRDPDFFEFYRSMNAYGTALDSTGTTMVLSPQSEFFRYFRNPTASEAPAADAGGTAPAPARRRRAGGTTAGTSQ